MNDSLLTLSECLHQATSQLDRAGISTARLDVLVLLEETTGKDRAWLLANPNFIIKTPALYKLRELLARRAKHEPLAYIRGKSSFYGREFIVSPHTLEPRPETETMIDLLKSLLAESKWGVEGGDAPHVIDVGTGSGCLAISTKLEIPNTQVYATDIDSQCIKVARQNVRNHNVHIKLFEGNLLDPIPTPHAQYILLCNLPYVPDNHTINQAAMFEPSHAIFGGTDGLELYRQLFEQVRDLHNKPQIILTESLPFQHTELANIAYQYAYNLMKTEDFIQVFKSDG